MRRFGWRRAAGVALFLICTGLIACDVETMPETESPNYPAMTTMAEYEPFRGQRHRESTGSTRRKDAVDLLRQRNGEMGQGKLVGPREESVTFEDLVAILEDDYVVNRRKSTDRMLDAVKRLRHHFGGLRALDITPSRVKTYVRARQEEGAANATIQKETAALKRAFSLAIESEVLTRAPKIPSPQVRNVRKGFLDGADLEAVLRELPEYLRSVARFASITGWRKREILGLQWSQVDALAGTVRLEPGTTKNDAGREVPYRVIPELVELFESRRAETDRIERNEARIIPWVFHRGGNRIRDMRGAWDGACSRAGVVGIWFHDLRRTAVRNLERAGVPRSVAMEVTGHKTESVYRRYAIVDDQAMAEGLEKLAAMREGCHAQRTTLPFSAPADGTVMAQSAG